MSIEGATPTPADEATPTPADEATPTPADEATPTPDEGAYKLPEGVELTADDKVAVEGLFTDAELNAGQQQKVIDFLAEQGSAGMQAQEEAKDQMIQEWNSDVTNDPELGGDNLEQNISIAKEALDKFGSPELSKILNESGFGSNPEVVRFMLNVGRTLKEDNPGAGGQQQNTPKSDVEILYGTQ